MLVLPRLRVTVERELYTAQDCFHIQLRSLRQGSRVDPSQLELRLGAQMSGLWSHVS